MVEGNSASFLHRWRQDKMDKCPKLCNRVSYIATGAGQISFHQLYDCCIILKHVTSCYFTWFMACMCCVKVWGQYGLQFCERDLDFRRVKPKPETGWPPTKGSKVDRGIRWLWPSSFDDWMIYQQATCFHSNDVHPYYWWKKSSWCGKYPHYLQGFIHQQGPGGAGFLPSTYSRQKKTIAYNSSLQR